MQLAHPQTLEILTAADVRHWLTQLQLAYLTDATSQRGILMLQELLAALIPKETLLLPTYPNSFNPETMSKNIPIADKKYTFQEAARILSKALSSIADPDTETVFSIADVSCLLRSVNEYIPGEFEIQRISSYYYKVIYKSEEEVIESFKERWEGFIE